MKTKIFATLGPAGSNHDLNTRRYIDFHGLDAKAEYFASFIEGLKAMLIKSRAGMARASIST